MALPVLVGVVEVLLGVLDLPHLSRRVLLPFSLLDLPAKNTKKQSEKTLERFDHSRFPNRKQGLKSRKNKNHKTRTAN